LFRVRGQALVVIPHDPDPAAREVETRRRRQGPAAKAAKAPDAERSSGALKKAAAPPSNQPAKGAAKETPPVKTAPQPKPHRRGQGGRHRAPPAKTTPQPDALAPAKDGEDKKSSALQPASRRSRKLQGDAASEGGAATAGWPGVCPAPSKEAEDKKAAAAKAAKAKAKKKATMPIVLVADWNINPFAAQAGPPGKK
jgi:hypothetical protein